MWNNFSRKHHFSDASLQTARFRKSINPSKFYICKNHFNESTSTKQKAILVIFFSRDLKFSVCAKNASLKRKP